ncbi:hypothetical protein GDO78_012646 [Eleutherodactylus coqui]|uniref:Centrosomal protein 192 n=1 Tax=Eleutherodactylus coqui TaxID=57060 RepID=A0A8J6F0C1_ELECQ|nr:hypothetical protein GDO78_012646 [Eleutherodactylus coqui]
MKLQKEPTWTQRNDVLYDLQMGSQSEKDGVFSAESLFKGIVGERQSLPDVELSSSTASFLENEKLVSIASLDGSSSDELDDEEFFDDQLEAYFKRLLPPGMQHGAIEGQEIQDTKKSSYVVRNSFPSTEMNPQPEHIKLFEDYEGDFQMPHVHLATTGMDSAPASDDDVELELKRPAQPYLEREHFLENTAMPLAEEHRRPYFHPGLEGGSSEDESSLVIQSVCKDVSACRQSAEGVEIRDGSSGIVDGTNGSRTSEAGLCELWKKDMVPGNTAEEESIALTKQSSCNSISSLANTTEKLNSIYFQDGGAPNGECGSERSANLSQMFSHTNDTSAFGDSAGLDLAGKENVSRLADTYLLPTYSNQTGTCRDIWHSDEMQPFQVSFQQSGSDKGSQPHSVVYKNEEGKWVTDLAYYKSFEKEAGSLSKTPDDLKDEDFVVGGDALAMLNEDQEEFEKENKFIQPSFGYHIISPEKQEPIVLLRNSTIFENSEHNDTIKFCDSTLTPEDLECLPDDQKGSTTFDIRMPESKQDADKPDGKYKDNAKEQHLGKEYSSSLKPDQTAEATLLHISTIASALANASCSAEPSELAAMIMALSNKYKNASTEHQQSKHLLNSSEQKDSLSNFDMERYLKAPVNNGQDADFESFVHSVKDFTLNMSAGYKQPLQDSVTDLAHVSAVQKQGLKAATPKEVLVGCDKLQSTSNVSKDVSSQPHASYGNLWAENSPSSEIPKTKHTDSKNSISNTNQEKENKTKRNLTIAPLYQTSSEDETKRDIGLAEGKSRQKECNSLKSCFPSNAKKTSSRSSNDPKVTPCAKEACNIRDDTQKHVSFQPPSSGTHQKISDYSVQAVEEEHYSFRPSTAPLIHSSPSQDSIKLSEKGSPQELESSQKFCNDGLSPNSSYPSLSRLTYVSVTEDTLQNTTSQSPDNKKSNNTIELSTTIVRASPTPSEMAIIQNHSLPWQESKCQKYSESAKVSRSPSGFRTSSASNSGSKTEDTPKADGKITETGLSSLHHKDKVKELNSDLLGDKCFETQSDGVSARQLCASKSSQGLSSGDMLQAALLEKYNAVQNIPGSHQWAFAQSFKPVFPPSNLQKFPTSDPRLLNAPSLTTSAFAQPYLTSVSPVPHFTVGSHAGYPGCALQGQNIHDPMTSVPLAVNVASSIFSTLPIGNHASGIQSNSQHIHLVDSQTGPAGLSQWATRMSSGFGQVLAPEEVTFPNTCCVGIASQASLNIFNPNERWMQVKIGIISIAVNGEKIDVGAHQCLIFKNKIIIGPRVCEDVKILLLPQRAGLFQYVLSLSSWPVSADAETIVRAETMSSRVLLTAVSEFPLIEVDTGKMDCLDFGDLSSGSWKTLPIRIINKTQATVPIRLIISANATAWRCFTFSKNPAVSEFPVHTDTVTKMSSPSIISHVMYASYDNEEPEVFGIWVVFHAPKTYNSTACPLGPPEEFIARVDIEVDSPGPSCLLRSIPLHARVGSILVSADMSFVNGSKHLHVIFSSFRTVSLKIIVQPSGPQYEVTLIGECELPVTKNTANRNSLSNSDVPSILSNKQFVSWGGVALGRAVQQKLTLRNTSTISSQNLRLLIRGQDQDCFQLQSSFGLEERLTNNRELTIRPKEDSCVQLMFSPTRVGCMLAKLEIKQSGIKPSQPGVKFTIPLSGYGGTSNVILEGVKKLPDTYMITLSGVMPDRVSRTNISIKNTGSRAAYVKAICFANAQKDLPMDSSSCLVTPEKFVLKEGTHQSSTSLLFTVCFFCGDEVSRQQFRRALLYKPESAQKAVAGNTKLKNVRFDEEFHCEQLVTELYDLPQRPNDVQLFYGNMRKVTLSVFGSFSEEDNRASLQPYLNTNIASPLGKTERNLSNTSLDVLPVKGPQGPLLPNTNVSSQNNNPEQHLWTVQPESLVLRVPTVGGLAATGHIQIENNSPKSLQFDLSWPAHCLTITPQHGNVEPQSRTIILVCPNPSMSTKQSMLPWNGQVYVHGDFGQKIVKVQVTSEPSLVVPANDGVPKSSPAFSPRLEAPVHIAKPLSQSPSSKVEIKNRTIAIDQSGDVYRATYAAFRCSRVSGVLAAHEKLKVPVTFFPRDKGDYTQSWDLECHPFSEPHLKYKVRFQLCGEGVQDEKELAKSSVEALVADGQLKPRKRSGSEASSLKPVQDAAVLGVFSSEELYTFPSTLVGQSSSLKVNLRNNSFTTYLLKFLSPKEPFHMKHSKYSLRGHHYINLPVKFKPTAAGTFEGRLVVQTDAGDICIQLLGEALPN